MPKKVLLVEDEAVLAIATARMIEKHGFKVMTVLSGEKALAAVRENADISLILVDIDLGEGMDGTEVAREILKEKELPIIFHTSHSEKEYVDRVKKITGYGYVLKNSGEFILIESINMAYTLFEAKRETQSHLKNRELAYQEMEAREYRLRHVNRVLLSLRNINQIITNETDASLLLDKACQILIETSGYHKVWVILMEKGVPREPFYHSGLAEDFSPLEKLLKRGVVPKCGAKAVESRELVLITEPSTECSDCPFMEEYPIDSCRHGEKATMTMPLEINENVCGWISVIIPSFYSENPDEHTLFREIARDLSYALHNLKTERKLIESEEKYRALYENAPLPYQSLDPKGNFIDINPSWLTTLGYTRGEVMGKNFADFLHPSWKPHFEKNFPAFKKRGYVHDVQFRIRHKNGNYRDISFEGCIGYQPDGSVRQTYCVFKDITEQKMVEEENRRSRENLRITLNSIGDAVISTDLMGNVFHINPVAERLTGWEIDSARGKALHEVFHIVNADTRDVVDNPMEKVMETGEIVGLANHTLLISRDGREYQIADSAAPIRDDSEEICGVVLVFRDVTEEYDKERRITESERKYRGLFNSIRDAILVADTQRKIVDCNSAFTDLFGYELEEIKGRKTVSVYESEDEYRQMGNALKAHKGELSDFLFPVHYKKKDGTVFHGETNIFYLKDDEDDVAGFIGLIRDITDRKQHEENLQRALEEKDFLMKELNHRVKNNLNMITSLINLKDSEATKDLSDIKNQIHAIRFIHEKLQQVEDVSRISIRSYIRDLLESVFSTFSGKKVEIDITADDLSIETNKAIPLGLIINEIATNAIKHGFTERVEPKFSVDLKKGDDRHYLLKISNTGKPFPEDIDIEKPESLGLQLILTLVDQLQGSMELQKKPAPCFTISFPEEKGD